MNGPTFKKSKSIWSTPTSPSLNLEIKKLTTMYLLQVPTSLRFYKGDKCWRCWPGGNEQSGCIYCVSVSVMYKCRLDWIWSNSFWMHCFIYRVNWMALFGCRELINVERRLYSHCHMKVRTMLSDLNRDI